MKKTNIILILLIVLMVAIPLAFMGKNAEFAGADDQGTDAITQVESGYKPWFEPVWKPPSGEIECFFFALQAAIGAGFIGYFLGYYRKRDTDSSKKA